LQDGKFVRLEVNLSEDQSGRMAEDAARPKDDPSSEGGS